MCTQKNREKPQESAFFGPLSADFGWIFVGMPSGNSWGHFETIGASFDQDPAELWPKKRPQVDPFLPIFYTKMSLPSFDFGAKKQIYRN